MESTPGFDLPGDADTASDDEDGHDGDYGDDDDDDNEKVYVSFVVVRSVVV